jgi:hypothetical protein
MAAVDHALRSWRVRTEIGAEKFFIVEVQYIFVVESNPGWNFFCGRSYRKSKTGAMAAVDHVLRSWRVRTEIGAACCYDFVALLVTVVVSCGVFGSSMRASHTLIHYHASLLKMFCDSRKFYDSHKSDVDMDTHSDERD